MDTTTCKNCGAEYGLHHYQTNQCPVGGREAAIGEKQEWKTTVYEAEKKTFIDLEPKWTALCKMAHRGVLPAKELMPACEIADIVRQAQKEGKESITFKFVNGEVVIES